MNGSITTFKIRIDTIKEHAIGFELFVGGAVDDAYVNLMNKGNYNVGNRLILTPRQFADFSNRLISYVYINKHLSDEQLSVLWDTKITVYDHESPSIGASIFMKNSDRIQEISEKRKLEKEKRRRK